MLKAPSGAFLLYTKYSKVYDEKVIIMATMSTPKTGQPGTTSWEYYIEDKVDWIRYQDVCKVEGSGAALVDEQGKIIKDNLSIGTPIKILSNKTKIIGSGTKGNTYHASVEVEDKQGYLSIRFIKKPTKDTTAKENIALSQLSLEIKKRMKDGKTGICIIIKNRKDEVQYTFRNCTGAETFTGTPKADFSINSGKERVCYISHKDAGGARAYQQYVSITGVRVGRGDVINSDPAVVRALDKFAKVHNDIVNKRVRFKVSMPVGGGSDLLLKRAIYGLNFGGNFDLNNVHIIGQGKPYLIEASPKDKPEDISLAYELKFSDDLSTNGDLSHFKKGGYEPILFCRFQGGRKFYSGGKTYDNVRVLLGPSVLSPNAKEV